MEEESHLDEMRAAIRGDFERLAERRGDDRRMRTQEPELHAEPVTEVPESDTAQRSWLARFLSPES